jgi:hypothetical protein
MRISHFAFGVLEIDGVTYEHDVVIDRGEIQKRKKKASKKFRDAFGHTPLAVEENLPWRCTELSSRTFWTFTREFSPFKAARGDR